GNLLKPGYSRLLSIFPRAMYAGAWLLGPIPLQTGFRLYWPRILVRAENSSKPERKALAPSVNQRPERQSPLHFVAPWAGLNMSKGSGQTFILFVARINNGANEESPELFRMSPTCGPRIRRNPTPTNPVAWRVNLCFPERLLGRVVEVWRELPPGLPTRKGTDPASRADRVTL